MSRLCLSVCNTQYPPSFPFLDQTAGVDKACAISRCIILYKFLQVPYFLFSNYCLDYQLYHFVLEFSVQVCSPKQFFSIISSCLTETAQLNLSDSK